MILGLFLSAVTSYAWTPFWNGTTWITNCGVVDAEKIAENFEYLKQKVDVAGTVLWLQSGTSAYYNTGNVGIGTASPAQKLDVNGNVKGTGLCIGSDCKTSCHHLVIQANGITLVSKQPHTHLLIPTTKPLRCQCTEGITVLAEVPEVVIRVNSP